MPSFSPVGNQLILYIILGLLIAGALLGPLIAVVPSKRQRYLADLREQAARLGLSVRLRPLPNIPPRFRFEPPQELMSYELRRPFPGASGSAPTVLVLGADGWSALELGGRVPSGIEALPEGVLLVTFTEYSIAAAWDERGGEEALKRLATVLGELQRPQ